MLLTPPAHLLVSWTFAHVVGRNRRERAVITWMGVAPDLDGFGYPVEYWITAGWEEPVSWFFDYHHTLGHNIGFCLVCTAVACWLTRSPRVALWACASFHLHLLCDVAGSRGGDGYQWPIPYLLPLTDAWQWTWSGQWELGSWRNRLLSVALFLWSLWAAPHRGCTPLEVFSLPADEQFVATLRRWRSSPRPLSARPCADGHTDRPEIIP